MNLDRYKFEINKSSTEFTFISEGHLGRIEKAIQYEEIQKGFYNLGFGDVNPITREIDDTIVTNNGDMTKILATVAYSLYVFTSKNPNVWIYVTGSSQSRIRLLGQTQEILIHSLFTVLCFILPLSRSIFFKN